MVAETLSHYEASGSFWTGPLSYALGPTFPYLSSSTVPSSILSPATLSFVKLPTINRLRDGQRGWIRCLGIPIRSWCSGYLSAACPRTTAGH